jgi:apolipoprotein N-acyltransferase
MMRYGDMPTGAPTLLLMAFSVVLGLYFGLFGLAVASVRRASESSRIALIAAPIFWTALELAASRITSVPWDQLGYSQVDNALVNQLAPCTGVYGISFVLVAVNALIAGTLILVHPRERLCWGATGALLSLAGWAGIFVPPLDPQGASTAILVQPNLDVGSVDAWLGEDWNRHISEFIRLAEVQCDSYIAGIPQTGAATHEIKCQSDSIHPDLVVWPESPAPFAEGDPRLLQSLQSVARATEAPLVVGSIGMDYSSDEQVWRDYNSALIISKDGTLMGRYDKIHLVPFGEYVPFKNLLFFARKLTGRVSEFRRGDERKVFRLNGRRYGVFICYEAVFADEIRQFARLGAEVLVNISDDGWYGDTSAPWQHLNIARMRAIENRRWLLRDTNNGVTAVIDPYGRVRQSIPRHQVDALAAKYAYRDDMTFYTAHGDVFASACAILGIGIVGWAFRTSLQLEFQLKARS